MRFWPRGSSLRMPMAAAIVCLTASACVQQGSNDSPSGDDDMQCPTGACTTSEGMGSAGSFGSATAGSGGWPDDSGLFCSPGERSCEGPTIVQCSTDGQSHIEIHSCPADQFCNPTTVVCETRVCQADAPACDGQVATLCNTVGDGFVPGGSDCAAIGRQCLNGQCLALNCVPGQHSCIEGNVHRCADDGMSMTLVATCTSEQLCLDGMPACLDRVCEPGLPACDGPRATLCNAEGTGFEPGGTDCGAMGRYCVEGQCSDQLCEPESWVCVGKELFECNEAGDELVLDKTCDDGEFCSLDPVGCDFQKCTPGAPTCDGQRASVCKADGSGVADGGRDCAAEGLGCAKGECVGHHFEANFDDGNLDAWVPVATHTFNAIPDAAARNTDRGLRLISNGSDSAYEGIYHRFPIAFQPSYVSYWVRLREPPQRQAAIFALSPQDQPFDPVLFALSFTSDLSFGGVVDDEFVSFTTATVGSWIHIEIENIDWVNKTYDCRFNGTTVAETIEFRSPRTAFIDRLDLFHYGAGQADFDEIVVR